MSRSKDDDIETALNTQLSTLGFANVAWENQAFNDPVALWVRPTYIPAPVADVGTEGFAGSSWLVGVYQVDVFSPLNGGDGQARDAVGIIQAGFPKNAIFSANGTAVRVGRNYREVGRRDPEMPYFHIPVKIEFYANF